MAMLQHYFTSCLHGTSGQAGFQTKAESPGISPEVAKTVSSMINYRIPPSLDERAIAQHPIALRYDYLGPTRCILTCCQSNGTDEKGRNGNYFAHTIITSPQDFATLPPIMFWRHSFWKSHDSSDRLEIRPEPSFELEPSLELQAVWPFFEQPRRREWFQKLLSATVQYAESRRPIVILDDANNVALWIAAVTFALPPGLRTTLTFATYHHDPYAVPYCITGTTRPGDSTFRCSSDEYISYFVLNALDGRVSATPDSPYATYVCERYFPGSYEEKLLDFFLTCHRRLPPRSQNAARYLDDITRFVLAVREGRVPLSDSTSRRAVSSFLSDMEARESVAEDELGDLRDTVTRMLQEVRRQGADSLDPDYSRSLALLKRHDTVFHEHIKDDIDLLAEAVLGYRPRQATELLSLLDSLYPADLVRRTASDDDYLARISDALPPVNLQVPTLLWKTLGRYLRSGSSKNGGLVRLVQSTLLVLESIAGASPPVVPPQEAQALVTSMLTASPDMERVACEALRSASPKLKAAPYWLYYGLAGTRTLPERQSYRQLFAAGIENAVRYEVKRDLVANPLERAGALLEEWNTYLAQHPDMARQALQGAIEFGISYYTGQQRTHMVQQVLLHDAVVDRLDATVTTKLLRIFLSTVTLQVLPPSLVKLYQKFSDHQGLNDDQRAVMKGCLAMTGGKLDSATVSGTQNRLRKADKANYEAETAKWMKRFFDRGVSLQDQVNMLQAVYVPQYREVFWSLYWKWFGELALDRTRTADFIRALGFWFDEGLARFAGQPYVAQEFFMGLPDALEGIGSQKQYRQVARAINEQASRQPWYAVVCDYLSATKKKSIVRFLKR